MIYTVGKDFIKLDETSGTVQNTSSTYTIEMATEPVINSGLHVYPQQNISFRNTDIYLRCLNGTAQIRCVPFELSPKGVDDDVDILPPGDYIRLVFNFPTGHDKQIIHKNPRDGLTQKDVNLLGNQIVTDDIFRNDYAEPALGIKRAQLIHSIPLE